MRGGKRIRSTERRHIRVSRSPQADWGDTSRDICICCPGSCLPSGLLPLIHCPDVYSMEVKGVYSIQVKGVRSIVKGVYSMQAKGCITRLMGTDETRRDSDKGCIRLG